MRSRARVVLTASAIAAAVAWTAGCMPAEGVQASAPPHTEPAKTQIADLRPSPEPTPTQTLSPSETPAEEPRPAILERGDTGTQVRELQVRLIREELYSAGIDGVYGPKTERAVEDFQQAHDFPATGAVDQETWNALVALTGSVKQSDMFPPPPAASSSLDGRCLTGRVICADKTNRKLSWVIDGEVQFSMDARFGRASLPTANGVHEIYWKHRDHVSSIYEAEMPFSLFFNGGEAVHYSYEFKALGYGEPGGSHGCINTRNWELTERLFEEARVGDKVVVYGEY